MNPTDTPEVMVAGTPTPEATGLVPPSAGAGAVPTGSGDQPVIGRAEEALGEAFSPVRDSVRDAAADLARETAETAQALDRSGIAGWVAANPELFVLGILLGILTLVALSLFRQVLPRVLQPVARLVGTVLGVILLFLLALFAASNQHQMAVGLAPFPGRLSIPVWFMLTATFTVGFFAGAFVVYAQDARVRLKAWREERRARALEAELSEREQKRRAAAETAALEAGPALPAPGGGRPQPVSPEAASAGTTLTLPAR